MIAKVCNANNVVFVFMIRLWERETTMTISTCISDRIARPVTIVEGVIAGVGSSELM
jgi:hypothetical protein